MTVVAALLLAAQVIAGIQVQGNTATPDAEVRRLAGVDVGMPFDDAVVDAAAQKLRASKKFESVQVLKRFASIADPSQIMLVIVVDEGPVKIQMTGDPNNPTRVVKRRFPNLLFAPILGREDGVGFTYGVRLTVPEPKLFGKRSRVMYPVSWGGTKQAGIDIEKRMEGGIFDRVTTGASFTRRLNLSYQQNDDRGRIYIRGEREIKHNLRLATSGGWQHAGFDEASDQFGFVTGDVVFDTRIDPVLARNAVYARASVERLQFGNGPIPAPTTPDHYSGYNGAATKTELDGRGYLGLFGQNVLAARVARVDSDRPLPPYLRPMLGGLSTVRGYPAGHAVGDTMLLTSAEVIVPLTSPLNFLKMGVTAFVDRGVIYNKGDRLEDQPWQEGIGGSVWFTAAFFRLNIAVAHGRGSGTRAHVGGNITY